MTAEGWAFVKDTNLVKAWNKLLIPDDSTTVPKEPPR